uniref:non-specific serine/threonine protein kinase n=1 Tax=Oryza rufipogon TaxID=4529 RepID=A0A0E0QQ76_ORYRU
MDADGFLSIDCGLEGDKNGYTDNSNGLVYTPDGAPYVDTGVTNNVSAQYVNTWDRALNTLRSFPLTLFGERNCYALPTVPGAIYLVRLRFAYGNYDNMNSESVQFSLLLGVNHWDEVYIANEGKDYSSEAMFVAWASWASVCLVNTNQGTPFVNTVELRQLDSMLHFRKIMGNSSIYLYERRNMGPSSRDNPIIRYPNDTYDRFWYPWGSEDDPTYSNLSAPSTLIIPPSPSYAVPSPVLETAVVPADNNKSVLSIIQTNDKEIHEYLVLVHYADFQSTLQRQFQAYSNGDPIQGTGGPYVADYTGQTVGTIDWISAETSGKYNITLAATDSSQLPPIVNAFEVYGRIPLDNPSTFPTDFDAIMTIKFEYGIKKNWMNDPCFPSNLVWNGVRCSTGSDNTMRIISLDLSNSNLHGSISNNFTLLTALEYLNLSGNQLSGTIPSSLCENNAGSFVFRFSYLFNVDIGDNFVHLDSTYGPEFLNAPGSTKNHWDHMQKTENRRFTYEELEKYTDNFERLIGHGGFGQVYYGCLEENIEVAVKMRSESSQHGLDEFLAEVQSLTKVHHRNLVSLVGYCWENDHLALVYEYMSGGNLCDHLRGKISVGESLNWATRLRILLEAGQGLDYLHKGCNLPIIHGDVKTNNILLGQNLKAKIADFGLSKTYHSDTQTHISATAAGSVGYIDPEYYNTGRLMESSDVYSFGVVLLEVVTGEPPIIPGHGHIVQRVKQKIVTGNISSIADARLDAYNVSSMWKVVDTAMMCTADVAAQRPVMATVVAQLKEGLALEEAHEERVDLENIASDIVSSVSTFGPSPR